MARDIKHGMWVSYNGKTGIAHVGDYREKDGSHRRVEEFHQVNDKGETLIVVSVPFAKLKQARLRDIHKARMGAISAESARKRWGYQ